MFVNPKYYDMHNIQDTQVFKILQYLLYYTYFSYKLYSSSFQSAAHIPLIVCKSIIGGTFQFNNKLN